MNKKIPAVRRRSRLPASDEAVSVPITVISRKKTKSKKRFSFPVRLSTRDRVFFVKRLAFLLNGGVPLLESLQIMREHTRNRSMAKILDSVITDISNGQALSRALNKFPSIFGKFAVNIIKVGEASGTLSQNLNYLADELNKKQALKRKMISALVYPAFITVATLGITLFLTVYLFPKLMPVFLSLRMDLPLSTRIVIWLSTFLRSWGGLTVLVLAVLIVLFSILYKRSSRVHFWVDAYLLKLPMLSPLLQDYNLANFSRTMGLLLQSGLSLSNALLINAETCPNLVYQKHFRAMSEVVNRGERISTYLKQRPKFFSDILIQMVSVGERSGGLPQTFLYLSNFYEQEVDDMTKRFSSLIEPVLMIVMGLLVGLIAISIITPIYEITQSLHP